MEAQDCIELNEKEIQECQEKRGLVVGQRLFKGCFTSFYPYNGTASKIIKVVVVKQDEELVLLFGKSIYERDLYLNGLVNAYEPYPAVAIYQDESFLCGSYGYIVMDRYRTSMYEVAQRQSVGIPKTTLPIFVITESQLLQMFTITQLLTERNVIHGDLKLEQFLLPKGDDGMAVTNFSLAGYTERSTEFPAILGWQPFGSRQARPDVASNTLPLQNPLIQSYFNVYQLMLYLQQRNLFVTLIKKNDNTLYYLDRDVTKLFPDATSPFHIPARQLRALSRFLYGETTLLVPTTDKYETALANLGKLSAYTAPSIANNSIKELYQKLVASLQPVQKNTRSTASLVQTPPVALVPFIPASISTVKVPTKAPIESPKQPAKGTFVVFDRETSKVPCELRDYLGYDPRKVVSHGRFLYLVLVQDSKRYVFRRNNSNRRPKWKPIAVSKLSRILQNTLLGQ